MGDAVTTVGLKMLKENLAAYVTRARQGERVIITDRGEEVAELVPLSPERRAMLRLVAEGRATWNGQRPRFPRQGVPNHGRPASDVIVEERHDPLL
jgi:prevent-host-death family protein